MRCCVGNYIPALADTNPAPAGGDLLAICGDSITEQRMYSVFMEDYLLMCKPADGMRVMQFGWSGDTSWGFLGNKIDNDVLRFHPSMVTTCFGMNDGGYNKITDATAEHYRQSTQTMIEKFKAAGVHTIIIGSPGCVGDELKSKAATAEIYNQTLASLRDIDKDLAAKNGVMFADVFTPMFEFKAKAHEKYGRDYRTNGNDGIHPMANGHLVMAYAFLKAMGFSGDIGTITVDLATNTASATEGHTLAGSAVKDGAVEVDSTRYPFCFTGDPKDPNSTSGVIGLVPFNQELNRLTLIVKNATSDQLKVTWGKTSRQFAAADLARGINLAAEFLDNPFSEAFARVQDAVRVQQNFETPFIKTFVANLPSFEQMVSEEEHPTLDRLVSDGATKDKTLAEKAAALVKSVHHTIKIDAVK